MIFTQNKNMKMIPEYERTQRFSFSEDSKVTSTYRSTPTQGLVVAWFVNKLNPWLPPFVAKVSYVLSVN